MKSTFRKRKFVACLVAVTCARAQERIALLIGNQGYTDKVGPLKNPNDDVAIVGQALATDGFKVTTHSHLERPAICLF